MPVYVGWALRAQYVRIKHGIDPAWAADAANDPAGLWFIPDPASRSGRSHTSRPGRSHRVTGYSEVAGAIRTVILVPKHTLNDFWGANAWEANGRDRSTYQSAQAPLETSNNDEGGRHE